MKRPLELESKLYRIVVGDGRPKLQALQLSMVCSEAFDRDVSNLARLGILNFGVEAVFLPIST
jgi:hypothetical protein